MPLDVILILSEAIFLIKCPLLDCHFDLSFFPFYLIK